MPCVAEVVNKSLKADCTDFTTCFCAFLKLFLFEKTKGIHSSGQFRFFDVWVKMKAVALLSKMTHISFIW